MSHAGNRSLGGRVRTKGSRRQSAHWMTGVPLFILLADIGDQRLRTLQLNFEGGNQRVFRVNNYVSRFPLKFKNQPQTAPVCSPDFSEK